MGGIVGGVGGSAGASSCKSRFFYNFVNLFFILVLIQDQLTDFCGNLLLQTCTAESGATMGGVVGGAGGSACKFRDGRPPVLGRRRPRGLGCNM